MSSSLPDSSTPGSSGLSSRGRSWSHFQFPLPQEGSVPMDNSSQDNSSQDATSPLNNMQNPAQSPMQVDQQTIGDLFATLSTQSFNYPVQGMYQPPVDAMGRPMGWPLGPQEMPGLVNCGNYPGWNQYAALTGQSHVSSSLRDAQKASNGAYNSHVLQAAIKVLSFLINSRLWRLLFRRINHV